ncbi:methyltransferase [Streptomyces sp. NBC_01239]|uniref:methyltransferase n=1 Tax=Streptomyces sp. NBC_01239 TaxID=2903792 RepID=UPI00224F0141|nr:methyltransferase [Streptomyces sp. NBC_01239]MCX4816369.1 methyltransferase [Streptomyces sp. NBC_01239]
MADTSTATAQQAAQELRDALQAGFTAQLLRAFVRLGIADLLADGPRDLPTLTKALGAHPGALAGFLGACSGEGLVEGEADGRIAVTDRGLLLRPSGSLGQQALWVAGPGASRTYEHITEVVRTGKSGGEAAGEHLYDYYAAHLEEATAYEEVMSELTEGCIDALLEAYDFTAHRRIVDVGGGRGTLLARVLERAPEATGLLYDAPYVVDMARGAQKARTEGGEDGRLEFAAGDFLESVPGGGDLYVIKSILCDWGDEEAARLLRNVHEAAPEGAELLIVDWFRPEPRDGAAQGLSSGGFFIWTLLGGRLRTATEMEDLVRTAGFKITRREPDFAPGFFSWNFLAATRD